MTPSTRPAKVILTFASGCSSPLFQDVVHFVKWPQSGVDSKRASQKCDPAIGFNSNYEPWGFPPLAIRILPSRWESRGSTDQALLLNTLFPLEKAPGQPETSPMWPTTDSSSCPRPVALRSQQHTLVSPCGTSCCPTSSPCFFHLLPPHPWKNVLAKFSFTHIFLSFFFFFWMLQSIHSRHHQSLLGVGNISRCSWKHLCFTACFLLQLNREKSISLPWVFLWDGKTIQNPGRGENLAEFTVFLDFTLFQMLKFLFHQLSLPIPLLLL